MRKGRGLSQFVREYVAALRGNLDGLPVEDAARVIQVLRQAYAQGKQVFILGNGGSAATASHFATDLSKGSMSKGKRRFRVSSLTDNMALVTALSNDLGYESVFKEQLVDRVSAGDVVIVISASGNSENVIRAVEYAKSQGAASVGFLGFGGGKLKNLVDYHITIPSSNYGLVETIHQFLEHLIAEYFREKLEKES